MEEDAFSAFERQGWEKLAQSYHSYYAALTDQSIDALLVALNLQPGVRLLDVATGPGYLAAPIRKCSATCCPGGVWKRHTV
jgi:protein-L-isoaspartate O-methyltransferase